MLHIFKDLLIIGKSLDIGGPDSDTSSSALAVSNPTTSGSVGDLPHASTSSSVRDLPYSKSGTSSASNQEQSSLEEFSASTDSGTYSQWFFRSILTSCLCHSGLGGSEVSSEIDVGFFSSSMANVLTLSSLQTLHPMKRSISSKKSPVTSSTSVTCISNSMVFLFGSLSPTRHFLALINGKASALAMLEFSLQMVALTSSSMSVCPLGTQGTLTNFPKAFLPFTSNQQMFANSMLILRTAI